MLKAKQKLLSGDQPVLAAAVDRIVSALPSEMSGAGRVQYLGVLLCIIVLDAAGERATPQAVERLTDMHASHILKVANKLVDLGLLEREKIVASHGKGHQNHYRPIMNLSQIVRDASPVDRNRDISKKG